MGLSIAIIRKMQEAGLPDEDIQAYIDGWSKCPECEERRKSANARKKRSRDQSRDAISILEDKSLNKKDTVSQDMSRDEWFEWFEDIWGYYPKRKGVNPKKPAQQKFFSLLKTCADPEALATAICKGAVFLKRRVDQEGLDPQYVPMMTTWLNQERWNDEQDAQGLGKSNGSYANGAS